VETTEHHGCEIVIELPVPELSAFVIALLGLAGFAAGFVDSIAGGGGMISVPALLAVGLPPHLALGTNKLQSSFGSLTAALRYRHHGLVSFRKMWFGILATASGAFLGTTLIQQLDPSFLRTLIPALLVVIFLYTLFHPSLGDEDRRQRLKSWLFFLPAGLAMGFYDGFFGPGTGNIWTLLLILLLGLNLKKATAHTKVLNFTSNVVALGTFIAGGSVLWLPGLVMGAGQMSGAWIGSHLVMVKHVSFVRTFFLTIVGLTILKLLLDLV
jgi:uncharacterized protein